LKLWFLFCRGFFFFCGFVLFVVRLFPFFRRLTLWLSAGGGGGGLPFPSRYLKYAAMGLGGVLVLYYGWGVIKTVLKWVIIVIGAVLGFLYLLHRAKRRRFQQLGEDMEKVFRANQKTIEAAVGASVETPAPKSIQFLIKPKEAGKSVEVVAQFSVAGPEVQGSVIAQARHHLPDPERPGDEQWIIEEVRLQTLPMQGGTNISDQPLPFDAATRPRHGPAGSSGDSDEVIEAEVVEGEVFDDDDYRSKR
jgi:hypothetical protein